MSSTPDKPRDDGVGRALQATRTDDRGYWVYRFDEMCDGKPIVLIEQEGAVYELRRTKNGKLILSR